MCKGAKETFIKKKIKSFGFGQSEGVSQQENIITEIINIGTWYLSLRANCTSTLGQLSLLLLQLVYIFLELSLLLLPCIFHQPLLLHLKIFHLTYIIFNKPLRSFKNFNSLRCIFLFSPPQASSPYPHSLGQDLAPSHRILKQFSPPLP